MIREIHCKLPNNKDREAVSALLVAGLNDVNISFLSDEEFVISCTNSVGQIRSFLVTEGFRFMPKTTQRYHSQKVNDIEEGREFQEN